MIAARVVAGIIFYKKFFYFREIKLFVNQYFFIKFVIKNYF